MIITRIKHFLRNSREYLFCRGNKALLEDYSFFIFLDSKVPNIIEQIYPYFQKSFFNKNKVLIVFRFHFENIKFIRKALEQFSLNGYCFINLRDIPSIQDGVWFYTHNSMTNLAVINKNVYSKHIWMGHGDSEKVSSYKKIIRIYDFILVAGENTIDRFYQHHIFRKEEEYKFIRVGKVVLCSIIPTQSKESNQKVILFAPTWEGPMKEENYSTLHLYNETGMFLNDISKYSEVNEIILRFHPNTGIRDILYLEYCNKIIKLLLLKQKKLTLVTEKETWIYKYFYKVFGNEILYKNSLYDFEGYIFVRAITNISAMATMSYAENINTMVLYDSTIEVQEKVDILFTEKIPLNKFSQKLNQFLDIEVKSTSKVIVYEKGWVQMSQDEIFNQIITYIMREG